MLLCRFNRELAVCLGRDSDLELARITAVYEWLRNGMVALAAKILDGELHEVTDASERLDLRVREVAEAGKLSDCTDVSLIFGAVETR